MLLCTVGGVELHSVQKGDIEKYWDEARIWIEQSIPYSTSKLTIEGAYDAVQRNSLQLWMAFRGTECVGSVITSIYKSEQHGRGLNFELIGMEGFDDFGVPMMDVIEQHMVKNADVRVARVIGRPGWQRRLKSLGYTPTHFFTEKAL